MPLAYQILEQVQSGPASTPGMRMVRGDLFFERLRFCVGATVETAVPKDLTGYTYRLTVRHGATDAQLFALSTGGSGISVQPDGEGGVVTFTRAAASNGTLPIGNHRYDLEETPPSGGPKTLIAGALFEIVRDQSR